MSQAAGQDPGKPTIGDVREAHRLDEAALDRWLAANVEGYAGPLEVRQFQGGQSNPTYLLTTPGARFVMRKKPPGQLLASAHQVDREYRVMKALAARTSPCRACAACARTTASSAPASTSWTSWRAASSATPACPT